MVRAYCAVNYTFYPFLQEQRPTERMEKEKKKRKRKRGRGDWSRKIDSIDIFYSSRRAGKRQIVHERFSFSFLNLKSSCIKYRLFVQDNCTSQKQKYTNTHTRKCESN